MIVAEFYSSQFAVTKHQEAIGSGAATPSRQGLVLVEWVIIIILDGHENASNLTPAKRLKPMVF